ncbi:MAG: response regulator [Candidatus Andersenbacteria bacterium CG10_big_fil_rev_8_21_14_0_10_54_11]|uniref:Response regulator n=1 Tax=Candidatus Andersenbacteria bacterium CG10_big_fil_rev_8_21_14_0_10_54_11 TaxID=1974485 RepID=A0A2M6WYL6_9BACT|nr:MAG: response regulator [Candidatus Andersenbacteria bacterium CG10_big_fil_rev_8_21_14_0_10_54_11]
MGFLEFCDFWFILVIGMTDTRPPQRTVLIVEDDNFISQFLQTKLQEKHRAVAVTETAAADTYLAEHPVDLIVLDIMLPREDGFTWLERLKAADNPHRDIPVIILSNLDQFEDIQRGQKLGAALFLLKGNLMPSEIATKIDELLAEKQ